MTSAALTILRCYWPHRHEPEARGYVRQAIANERRRRGLHNFSYATRRTAVAARNPALRD